MNTVFVISSVRGKIADIRVEHPKLGRAWIGYEMEDSDKLKSFNLKDKSVLAIFAVDAKVEFFDFLKEKGWSIIPVEEDFR